MDAMRAKVGSHLKHGRESAIQESVLTHGSNWATVSAHSDAAVVVTPKPAPKPLARVPRTNL